MLLFHLQEVLRRSATIREKDRYWARATFGLRSGAPKEPDRRFMRAVETVNAMLDREC
jgi:hypothetical protein